MILRGSLSGIPYNGKGLVVFDPEHAALRVGATAAWWGHIATNALETLLIFVFMLPPIL